MQSKPKGLKSEVDPAIAKKAFDLIRTATKTFDRWMGKDIARLLDYVKIVNFQKNSNILKKGENIDFLGIVLSGRILAVDQEMAVSALVMGDLIGYMNWVNLPGGNPNRFDLRGEKEGYIAILQLSDQKVIEKRDPGLAFMLSKLCARACLETVSQQYEGVSAAAAELKNEVTELTSNKLNDILIGCPGFGAFYQSLETKDKRFFSNLCEVVEIKSEKKILNEYSPMHSIIIVLKGELISFTRNGPGTIFKAGDLLGVKEVLYDLCWKDNVYGRQNGYLVKVKKDFLFDLGNTFAKSAKHFLEYFLKYECMRIKDKFKGVKVGGGGGDAVLLDLNNNEEEEKIAKLASQVERFAEIQVNQKFKPLAGLEAGKEEKELDPFKVIRDPPIMTSLVYKTIMAQDADKLTKKDADKKDESSHKGYSCFIKDKLEFQYLEQKKKDKENKLRKKKGLPIDDGNGPSKTAQQQGKVDPQTIEALEIEYEKLKNDYNLRELSRERLKHEHEEILEKLMKTEKEVQRLKDKNFFVTAERDRLKLHKELAMKVKEVETGQSISIGKLTKSRADQRNFNDVFKEQIKASRKFKVVEKCAYKWLNAARKAIFERLKKSTTSQSLYPTNQMHSFKSPN